MNDRSETKEQLLERIAELEEELLLIKECYKDLDLSVDLDSARIFRKKYEEIRNRNNNFSIRALAKKVNVSSGKISDIFNGRYTLSRELAQRIVENLEFEQDQKEEFLKSVDKENTRMEAYRAFIKTNLNRELFFANEINDNENIDLVDNWICYAILAALELDTCDGTTSWIAHRLKSEEETIQMYLNKLIYCGLVENQDEIYSLVLQSNLNNSVKPDRTEASKLAANKCSQSVFNYLADRMGKMSDYTPDKNNRNYCFVSAVDSEKIGNVPEFLSQTLYNSMSDLENSSKKDQIYMMVLTCTKV